MTKKHHPASKKSPSKHKCAGAAGRAANPDLVLRLAYTLWLPDEMDVAEKTIRIEAAYAMLKDIAPADGVEDMLATQMIATHEAAMECLRRAMLGAQTPNGTDQNLKHAERLLAIYTRQVAVLDKHRSRERQRTEQEDRKPPVSERISVGPREPETVGQAHPDTAPPASNGTAHPAAMPGNFPRTRDKMNGHGTTGNRGNGSGPINRPKPLGPGSRCAWPE